VDQVQSIFGAVSCQYPAYSTCSACVAFAIMAHQATHQQMYGSYTYSCCKLPALLSAFIRCSATRMSLTAFSTLLFFFSPRSWAADHPAEFVLRFGIAKSNQLYLLVYMALVLLFICLLLTRDSVFSMWSIRTSTNLHNKLFRRVLSAPILFFLRTPVGDVLNAFARDQVSCFLSATSHHCHML